MSLLDFALGSLLGSTNVYVVDGKKYTKHYSDEFECDVLVPVDEEGEE